MITASPARKFLDSSRSFALLAVLFVVASCASTGPSVAPARIDVQQQVGFTITEEARVSGSVRADHQQALALLEQGHAERGTAMLKAVSEAAPNLSAPLVDLGVAYHRAGNLEAAEESLLRALRSNPNHPIAHNELGIVYRKLGRFAESRTSYQSALEIYPGYHYARRNLAVLCDLYLADYACALENYEAYMTTVPADDEASIWIADMRLRMGQLEEER